MVRLWVEDNGIGILPEYQENILESSSACTAGAVSRNRDGPCHCAQVGGKNGRQCGGGICARKLTVLGRIKVFGKFFN